MDLRFDGKIALVTGGASGIGAAIVRDLAEGGCAVASLDLNTAGGGASASAAAVERAVDVTDAAATAAAVDDVVAELGGLDIAVNCAGRAGTRAFLETGAEEVRGLVDVNLLSTIFVSQAVMPHLIERGGGRIVNIASDAGRVGAAGDAVYAAAKGGVIALTKSLALEFARYRITVNCVSPGPTDTPMLRAFAEESGAIVEKLIKATPLRKLGEPEDIAAAVVYLASEQAGHVTGQVLSVSGGLTTSG